MSRRLLLVVMMAFALWAMATDSCVSEIQAAMDATVNDLPHGKRSWPEYLREFGFKYDKNPSYGKMAGIVSNNLTWVGAHFSEIATNDIQRLMLLSCGWAYGESYYVDYYHLVADMTIKGFLTERDLRWYAVGHRSNKFLGLVERRYDEPRVSQLIDKLHQVSTDEKSIVCLRQGGAMKASLRYGGEESPIGERINGRMICLIAVGVVLLLGGSFLATRMMFCRSGVVK